MLSPQTSQTPRRFDAQRILFVAVALVVLAGIVYFGLREAGLLPTRTSLQGKIDAANTAHKNGNFDIAIGEFESALASNPSKMTEGYIKLRLAYDLFTRNQGNDRDEAVRVYKEVIDDQAMPAYMRALALGELAFRMDLTDDHHFFMNIVLTEEPYSTFLLEEGGDVHQAVRRMYELSDSIYPNTLAKFQTAFMMSGPLVNGRTIADMTQEQMAQRMQQLVAEGRELISDIPYESNYLAHLEFCSTMALVASNRILKNLSLEELEEGFDKTIAIAEASGDPASMGTAASAHIFNAIFLITNRNALGSSRSIDDEINEHLSIVAKLDGPEYVYVRESLANFAKRDESDFIRSKVIALAELNPGFKTYLTTLGWSLQ